MDKPEVTIIELTSGEIMNLIELIEAKINEYEDKEDAESRHLHGYYVTIAEQFDKVLDRLNRDVVPEQRLAKMVLAL